MKPVYNKLLLKKLPDSQQPKKTFLTPDAELLKKYEVLDIGSEVKEEISVGSIVTCYINHVQMIDSEKGFCTFRDPVFVDGKVREGKVGLGLTTSIPMTRLNEAEVVNSGSSEIPTGSKIVYIPGQGHILPDNTEIISLTQILALKDGED